MADDEAPLLFNPKSDRQDGIHTDYGTSSDVETPVAGDISQTDATSDLSPKDQGVPQNQTSSKPDVPSTYLDKKNPPHQSDIKGATIGTSVPFSVSSNNPTSPKKDDNSSISSDNSSTGDRLAGGDSTGHTSSLPARLFRPFPPWKYKGRVSRPKPGVEKDLLIHNRMDGEGGDDRNGKKDTLSSFEHGSNEKDSDTNFFVYYLACFATIGGLLFGYDTGIVSGAMLLIEDYFDLSTIWKEIIVSGTVGAAAVFALFAGFTCDFLGRKFTIMMASVVFTGGAVIMGAANSKEVLLAGRIVVGIGIGFASMTVPVYVAEAAPASIRGRLVTLNQLFITIGILLSSIIAGAFSEMKETGWRYMLGLAGVPGIIQFLGFFYLPESPRWLITKGKEDQAVKVLQRIRGRSDVYAEIGEIKTAVEENKKESGFVLGRVMSTRHVRKALFVGCGLQVFQQLCGINTVIYYSASILRMAGFPPSSAIWLVLVPNSVNFLATFIGLWLVERSGRKKLLSGSFVGVVIALIVLAVGFQLSANFSPSIDRNVTETFSNGSVLEDKCYTKNYSSCESCIENKDCGFCYLGDDSYGSCLIVDEDDEDLQSQYGRCNKTNLDLLGTNWAHGYCPTDYTWMAVLGLALFVFGFAPGLGPMPWTINAEIYPYWARSTCNSIATGFNWVCNLIVSLFFLTLTETITKYGAFWLFGSICFLGLLFTLIFVPETKNLTLEEVEELFKGNSSGQDNAAYVTDKIESPKKESASL